MCVNSMTLYVAYMTEDLYHSYSWKKPFFTAVLCMLVLLFLNDVAMRLYLFMEYPWFDIPLHFFGGFSVGLASIGLIRMVYRSKRYERSPQLLYIIVLTLFVGAGWEYVEYYMDASVAFGGNFWFDTVKDLLMDTLGGILSYICFHPQKSDSQI